MSLVLAAKVTHIPRMVLSELPGPLHGCRQDAIDGLRLIGDRIVQAGADTVVILDTHWLSNAAYHVNAHDTFQGVFQSTEFPTQIESLEFDHAGNPELAVALAEAASERGVTTIAHRSRLLPLEYGTLVPMHFMNLRRKVKVVSVWDGVPTRRSTKADVSALRFARPSMPILARWRSLPAARSHTASVSSGHASAVTALARFGSAARGDPIYDAGVQLGKLLRTAFLADVTSPQRPHACSAARVPPAPGCLRCRWCRSPR